MQKSKIKRGSILAEAMVAITVLIAAVVAVSTILNNAISTTLVSRDYLVAENLLNEGIESIKIIRDTNRMKWPQFTANCWLVADPSLNIIPGANGNGCLASSLRSLTNYIAKESRGHWKLELTNTGDLDLSNFVPAQDKYRLYLKVLNPGVNQYKEYLHDPSGTATKFYRSVEPQNIVPGRADFEIKVQWKDGSKVREIKENFTINNEI